jgi:hypothetical protein
MADYLEMLKGLLGSFGPREVEARMRPMDDRAARLLAAQQAQAPAPGTPDAEAPLTGRWYSPERREIHRLIGQATEAHPATVEVAAPETWPKEYEGTGGHYVPSLDRIAIAPTEYKHFPPQWSGSRLVGKEMAYNLPRGTSTQPGLEPMPPEARPTQDVLTHEQLHFLMRKLMQAEAEEEKARVSSLSWPALIRERHPWKSISTGAEKAFGTYDLQHQFIDYLLGTDKAHPILHQDTVPEPMTGTHPPPATPEIADAYRRLIHQIFPEGEGRERALAGLGAPRGGALLEEAR